MAKPRACVIGAGIGGVITTKICLDEGFDVVCFEKSDDLGGLWNYQEQIEEEKPSVYASTIINTSKEFMAFSDYPPPIEAPNFMHNTKLMDYFRSYADHFNVTKCIKFRHKVEKVVESEDYEKTGNWTITVHNLIENTTEELTFNLVLIATGHHCTPNRPEFKGLQKFKGSVVHTHDYKIPDAYRNKNVLVIGVGNSGLDTAVEIGRVAKNTYLSTRRGVWVLSRQGDESLPTDMSFIRRFLKYLPTSVLGYLAAKRVRFNHDLYGLRPSYLPHQGHPSVCDDLANMLISGRVLVRPDVDEFDENGVLFKDNSYFNLDAIILGTGYRFEFPFLPKRILDVRNNKFPLYKFMYLPDEKWHTLPFIGYVQPVGALNPIMELQAQWACSVFKGRKKLPSAGEMKKSIIRAEIEMKNRYYKSSRHTIQVDHARYCDEIASMAGIFPRIWSRFITDPRLAIALLFGPVLPYHYRLDNPYPWNNARSAILDAWDRVKYPGVRKFQIKKKSRGGKSILFAIMLIGLAYFTYFQIHN